jgi:hypothetical protein
LITVGDIFFIIALCLFFVIIKFWKNIVSYLWSIPKLCYDNSRDGCCCSAACHGVSEADTVGGGICVDDGCDRSSDFVCRNTNTTLSCTGKTLHTEGQGRQIKEKAQTLQPMMIFGSTGYYLASNDVDEILQCRPTPLQDTDPNDLA